MVYICIEFFFFRFDEESERKNDNNIVILKDIVYWIVFWVLKYTKRIILSWNGSFVVRREKEER